MARRGQPISRCGEVGRASDKARAVSEQSDRSKDDIVELSNVVVKRGA
jgi:hypothetical protein